MSNLLLLIPVALLLGLLGLVAFLWALRSGQFDDLDGAANRILFDDDSPPGPREEALREWKTRQVPGQMWDEGIASGPCEPGTTMDDIKAEACRRQTRA